MNWLKRLIRYFFQEESQALEYDIPPQASAPEVEVKVTYQYPSGKFRFPLIPDDRRSVVVDGEPVEKEMMDIPSFTSVKSRFVGNQSIEKERTKRYLAEKRPFRPTEVPSPVYGYKARPTPVERTTDESTNFSETNFPPEAAIPLHLEDAVCEARLFEEAVQGSKKAPFSEQIAQGSEEESFFKEAVQGSEEVVDEREEELLREEAPAPKAAPQKQEVTKTEERKPSSRIPYNVMMLKQDRKRLEEKKKEVADGYRFPSLDLLQPPQARKEFDEQWLHEQRKRLDETFQNFHIGAKVVGVTQGPTVTRFEVQPAPGVKVSKITSLADDIKLSLAAKDVRMEAPIPGKSTIGIEVPNVNSRPVFLREVLQSEAFRRNSSPLSVALGLDLSGAPIVTDIKKMPHGLIAGATGSGKSVCINAMLVSLLYKAAPHEVKLLLIDPKMVELAPYNHIPHLVSPVITDAKAATGALKWAVEEMERRYELFVHMGVRDIEKYNELVKKEGAQEQHLPYIVIIIDELADLMMIAPADVEEAICRIAQKARACGIHLLVATQRPSVDVITGLIKANIPTRIAFSVSSQVDSRTIIDTNGAEKLLGKGDMLFLENGTSKTVRLQGNFVSDEEIERVVAHVKAQMPPAYLFEQDDFLKQSTLSNDGDDLFYEACEFVVQQGGASTSSLQRRFRIGYNRAARLIEMMEEQGIISEARGSKPRDVLITEEELVQLQENSVF
ncbi:DNA translocase FtsK [Anoxybacteroides amylolyticum]|uniref:FtsK/SpoIIIE family protein n=1 Tax=Anoxybacteroides amylolyticum TaxID=294699 RepID=A0A161HZ13_9BACL|nr:DNA translocase FtsK [Anoxybacillus amylolyticus]ANB62130.1 ftsK/SpoIIIE family protein [Anoxybacillus amylolyticus]